MRDFVFLAAPGADVADRAIVRHARKTDDLLREAHGHLLAFLPNQPKRFIAARAGEKIGKDARKHEPDPIRNAACCLGADAPVLEALAFVSPLRFRFLSEEFVPAVTDSEQADRRDDSEPAQELLFLLEKLLPLFRLQ